LAVITFEQYSAKIPAIAAVSTIMAACAYKTPYAKAATSSAAFSDVPDNIQISEL